MQRALSLARRGWGRTAPNPMVGAVVVRGGRVVGEGAHRRFGGDHAEVEALRKAGKRADGASLYVTLEPCSHWGKTPPCTDAIIGAGIREVVCATRDPNPRAKGGAAVLRRAGIRVRFGLERAEAEELNAAFFFAMRGGRAARRPFVTLKLAVSADGSVARRRNGSGVRTAITGAPANREVHRMRAQHDAVAVGIGTALADSPRLTVRLVRKPRIPPVRIVFDRTARIPLRSPLVRGARKAPTVVMAQTPSPDRELELFNAGVELVRARSLSAGLQALARQGVTSLLVEGGPTLAAAFLRARAVDRIVIFRSPRRLGRGAVAAFDDPSLLEKFRLVEQRRLGRDVMTVYDPTTRRA